MRINAQGALILLLAAPLSFLLVSTRPDGTLPIPQPTSAAFGLTWEGTVQGPEGPLAGALVRIQATDVCTRTDAAGRFRLPRGRGPARITAWQPGHFIGGVSGRGPFAIHLQPLATEDNDNYAWVDPAPDPTQPGNCANCHASLYAEWAQSAHGRSADGRRLRNLYQGSDWQGRPDVGWGLLTEHPNGSGVCAACHAPSLADEDGARFDLRRVTGVAARGVHCDYCHKVAAVGDSGRLGLTHGTFDELLLRPTDHDHQIFFGPLDDVDRGEDVYAPLFRDSRYCASCHEGIVFGVHVYSTYSEWQASAAAAAGIHCQDCHMKPTGRLTNVAPGHGGKERAPNKLANHRFFDGHQEDMLRRCVRLNTTVVRQQGGVRATVRLAAEGAGHRVPTGFIDRHLVLVVEGLGAGDSLLPAVTGPQLPPAAGELAGRAGKLYAKRLTDFAGRSPSPFWRPAQEVEDTRLTVGSSDETVVSFPATVERIRVRVLYRHFWQETVRVKGWPDRDVVLHDIVSAPGSD